MVRRASRRAIQRTGAIHPTIAAAEGDRQRRPKRRGGDEPAGGEESERPQRRGRNQPNQDEIGNGEFGARRRPGRASGRPAAARRRRGCHPAAAASPDPRIGATAASSPAACELPAGETQANPGRHGLAPIGNARCDQRRAADDHRGDARQRGQVAVRQNVQQSWPSIAVGPPWFSRWSGGPSAIASIRTPPADIPQPPRG